MESGSISRRSGLRAAAAVAATVAVALGIALHDVTVPWWTHADPDGTYVGSSLSILAGDGTNYLDHPGLPTQVGLAVVFGADYAIRRLGGSDESRREYVERHLLDLDALRPAYRTWALLQYVGGALIVVAAVGVLLGPGWGLAGGLLFLATPGLAEISGLLRPDPLLAALCVAVAVAAARGFERRSAGAYLAAGLLLGLAVTVKLTALGLVPVVALAALVRPPAPGWADRLQAPAREWLSAHRRVLVPLAAAWLLVAVVLNSGRAPFVTTGEQRVVLATTGAAVGGFLFYSAIAQRLRIAGARKLFAPFYGTLALAFLGGMAVPATLALDAGAEMPVAILETLRGGRVNDAIEPFADFRISNFQAYEQRSLLVVGALGLLGAAVGMLRRQAWLLVFPVGAGVLATMAAARLGYDYYFAPAFAVMIPPALWLLREALPRRIAPAAAAGVVLVVLLPSFTHLPSWRVDPAGQDAERLAAWLLEEGEVALAPPPYLSTPSLEDTWYRYVVEAWLPNPPDYPYRFMDATRAGDAVALGFSPRYVVAPREALPPLGETAEWAPYGGEPLTVRTRPTTWGPGRAYGVAEIVEPPAG